MEEHERIEDIIKKYGHFLKMYTQYVNGYDKAMSVFEDTMKENAEFANLVSQLQECYGTIKNANVIADAVLGDIFRNLENIYLLDSKFLQELVERMKTWEEHERIGDIIKKYGHFLKMYNQYMNGYDKATSVFEDTMKENAEFGNLVSQFQECYGTIKNANVIADAVLGDVFRDLENIYLLDSKFLQELEERIKTWEEHVRIEDIIKKYGHFLKMYTQYVNGYDKAMSVFEDTMKENAEFANLVSQLQASERCNGMILSAYMLKPVQRIPSYRLLIDYLKHLPKDSEESKDTEITLKNVSEVVTHMNESMKKMDSFEQMLKLQRMLVGHPEIVKAGRDYLKEGKLMKLCRKGMQERMFFLLTDVLLYTTPVGGNQYKLNKMLPLLGMEVLVPDSPDFMNEFSIISTTRSFTLTASTPEERNQWVEEINNAIDVVTKRKITFVSKTGGAAALGIQKQEGDFKLGIKAPVWIPDTHVTMCMSCTSPFTLTNRRHHCRACGIVVCGSCSNNFAPLVYLDYTQARVCVKCYDLLLKDFHTDEIDIVEEEAAALSPLLQEVENAEKLRRKPTKFEIMRKFKSKKTKRKSQIMHPSRLTEVVADQEDRQMSGYLRFKKGRHEWKKAWFVLKNNVLYSYKASSDVVALETLPVLSYQIEDLGKEGEDFVFQLKHRCVPPLVFKAANETLGKRWLKELKKAIFIVT